MLSPAVCKEIARSLVVGKKQFDMMDYIEGDVLELFLQILKGRDFKDPEITFIQRRDHDNVDLVIGLAAETLTAEKAKAAQTAAREVTETLQHATVRVEFRGAPKDGEFLFYDAEQAMFIAGQIAISSHAQFNNVAIAYESALTLRNTPYRSPLDAFTLFSMFAIRCLEAGQLKLGMACIAQCEEMLEIVVQNGGLGKRSDASEYEMIILIGTLYEKCDETERSIEVGLKYTDQVKSENERYLLKQRISEWLERKEAREEAKDAIQGITRQLCHRWNGSPFKNAA